MLVLLHCEAVLVVGGDGLVLIDDDPI